MTTTGFVTRSGRDSLRELAALRDGAGLGVGVGVAMGALDAFGLEPAPRSSEGAPLVTGPAAGRPTTR
jgi:hypothetical protein